MLSASCHQDKGDLIWPDPVIATLHGPQAAGVAVLWPPWVADVQGALECLNTELAVLQILKMYCASFPGRNQMLYLIDLPYKINNTNYLF